MPELRRDPIQKHWVIIAAERALRPHDFPPVSEAPQPKFCPFCPGNEDKLPGAIREFGPGGMRTAGEPWWVRVLPNKYPALQVEGDLVRSADGIYDRITGIGAHEVIVDSHEHQGHMADLPGDHLFRLLSAYRERLDDLLGDRRLRYVQIFKNYGPMAGATLSHPHSQLIATPVTPRTVATELRSARDHFHLKERCLFCDILAQERKDGLRVVYENERFLVFCPYASRMPFEMQILPLAHAHDFARADEDDLRGLADALRQALFRMKTGLNDPPYNLVFHTSPNVKATSRRTGYWNTLEHDYHWHVEIMPRLTRIAGFEWGTGFHINPTAPEEAARFLREVEGPAS